MPLLPLRPCDAPENARVSGARARGVMIDLSVKRAETEKRERHRLFGLDRKAVRLDRGDRNGREKAFKLFHHRAVVRSAARYHDLLDLVPGKNEAAVAF